MGWLGWILGSALLLSFYDLGKKASVRGNAVFPTLFCSTVSGWAAVTIVLVARGGFAPIFQVSGTTVALLLLKSCIVGASWTATYCALKTLPITSAAPIRATGPLWTLLGAILIFGELPTGVQAIGMACAFVGCWLFSLSAKHERNGFWRNKAIAFAFLGTVLGSASALYDKRLLQQLGLPTGTVLWWFMGGMSVIYLFAALKSNKGFCWRWTIPCVGILLAASDTCYFNAISQPDAKIAVLSLIRRSSVVLTFLLGGAIFHETNLLRKGLALLAILTGVLLLCVK